MRKKIHKLKKTERYKTEGYWDLLIAIRLYIIFFLLIYPQVYILNILKYLSPLGIFILGISILLVLKYILFESRKKPFKFFIVLVVSTCLILANFFFSLIIGIVHLNIKNIIISAIICIFSAFYFIIMIFKKPLKKINLSLTIKKLNWNIKGKYINFKKRIFRHSLVFWLIISINLILVPYPIYIIGNELSYIIQKPNPSPNTEFGIWTYGQSLNLENEGDSEFLDNKSLNLISDAGIYFVYGVHKPKVNSVFISNIMRCKNHRIEVHLSIGPTEWSYTNIWSFKSLKDEIKYILNICKEYNLLGNPITTLVYDMETLVDTPFPFYGFNSDYFEKLKEYREIQEEFIKFNDFIKFEYNLNIRITSDIFQAIDIMDGDNDLMNLWGLIEDQNAEMSYMVYRRNNFGQNQILNHFKFINSGDIIILNAWKYLGYLCYEDIDCAIEDCRLVLGYPEKLFRLELWELFHFLESYEIEGLEKLINAICEIDSSEWPPIIVKNIFPYSFYWDITFIGIIMIDLYSPLFRILYNAY